MRTILVVEDDLPIRQSLMEVLELAGFAVVTHGDGQEALDWLRSAARLPEMILLDLLMPTMDGAHFRAEQQRDSALASIPVVLLTAEGKARASKRQLDVDAVLHKPFTLDELMGLIERFADRAPE
jgi:CheY-like chemotaxis protein